MRLLSLLASLTLFFGLVSSNFSSVSATSGPVVENPDSTSVLVNKTYQLPSGYVPQSLVTPNVTFAGEQEQLRSIAAGALENMFVDANQQGIELRATSGYRSYNYQLDLHQYYVNQYGEEYASQISAEAGHSEHQTGLAMDVTSPSVNNELTENFGNTAAGEWVEENADEYGFIIRYPEGKENITGYSYEPWHLRYVGTNIASQVMNNQITLEEYFSDDSNDGSVQTYTIQPGDTLWGIANQFEGVSVQQLQEWNPNLDPYFLQIGSEINVGSQESGDNGSDEENPSDGNVTYTIQAGDTFWQIAQDYDDVTVNDLIEANEGVNPSLLQIGQTIIIPTGESNGGGSDTTTYTIQAGDTFWAIARNYSGVTHQDIQEANPSVNPDLLAIGSEIVIPQ